MKSSARKIEIQWGRWHKKKSEEKITVDEGKKKIAVDKEKNKDSEECKEEKTDAGGEEELRKGQKQKR